MSRARIATSNTTPSPNGFDARISLWHAIMVAYGPANPVSWGSIEVVDPKWIGEFYDMKWRVPAADLQAWQHQTREHELLRSATRAALKERCKLVLDEQPSKADIFELIISKRGPRLTVASESVSRSGVTLVSGGVMAHTVENHAQVSDFTDRRCRIWLIFCVSCPGEPLCASEPD
jgi:uncharacterized protein (TIGR03435 family)